MRDELVVTVSELLSNPGSRRRLTFDQPVGGLKQELVRVEPDDPLHFDLLFEAVDGESVHVRGEISGRLVVTCRRCLNEASAPFKAEVSEVYRPTHDVWEEGYVVTDGKQVDLGVLTHEGVLLEMPINPTCREDCAGLCPSCGKDLNEGDCGCAPDEGDDRWGPLRDLLQG
ncbi:MAG TPA: DUF177 domain-containing protein [Actinomycetota bacterium]|nr:DUF177 domain-containing protein [Actinomycetota bacterium]